jgi:ABC-type lipopolysaccharide export system ATPase subunit
MRFDDVQEIIEALDERAELMLTDHNAANRLMSIAIANTFA